MATTNALNPWGWQDKFGFSQAIEVSEAHSVVYCAGQTPTDADGNPMHKGDMAGQMDQALDNLETVLRQTGLELRHVVRLNYYTTDMAAFFQAAASFGPRMHAAGCKPASTLLGVGSLFHPDVMIEIEATAIR